MVQNNNLLFMKKLKRLYRKITPFLNTPEPENDPVQVQQIIPDIEPVKVGEELENTIQADQIGLSVDSSQAEVEEIIMEAQTSDENESTVYLPDSPIESDDVISDSTGKDTVHVNTPLEVAQPSEPQMETEEKAKEDVDESAIAKVFEEKENSIHSEADQSVLPVSEPVLSDNKPFVKLAEECAELMNEFDGYSERLDTDEGKMMVELVLKRLQEILERCGLERIENETVFSVLRHTPVPMQLVRDGIPVIKTQFPGLALGNRVYRKARVMVDQTEHGKIK
jgi:hypothetical protein